MRIGDLSRRLTLQRPVSTSDGMGGVSVVWTTDSIVWGALWPVSATERIQSQAPTLVISHRVRIRYHGTIAPDWRLKYGNRYLSVVSIVNTNESDRQLDLMCREASA